VRITIIDTMIELIVVGIQAYHLMNYRLEKNSETSLNVLVQYINDI